VQNIRKDSGFELTDRISVTINENGKIQPSLIEFKDYICREILASSLEFVPDLTGGTTIEVNEATLIVNVKKS
jgi:isoleucyl-tRNA synthetase